MNRFILWFVKITSIIPVFLYYRKKIYYYGKKSTRNIKGKALIVSNHTAIMDYPLDVFTFFWRNIRTITADIIYNRNKLLGWFINKLGCIKVHRDQNDFTFMNKAIEILRKKGVVLVFPESRLPTVKDGKLLEFKPSYIYIALESNSPIIPVYTNGSYMKKKRAKVVIGEPINLLNYYENNKSSEENIVILNNLVKNEIEKLKLYLYEKEEKNSMDL